MTHWWNGYPWRMVQTNLREKDMQDMDAGRYVRDLKEFGATVVTLNAAGIVAGYDTKLSCQTKSEYLTGDSLKEIVDECHRNGIRVICRTDFSKVRYPIYEAHRDWAYHDKNGDILNYNGDVQMCPSGEYQGEKQFEIINEVLTKIPFDGIFCNMSGFLVVDYSGIYHGPCHCENCRRGFKEMFGENAEIPDLDDPADPWYMKYTAFKNARMKKIKAGIKDTVKAISEEIAINGLDYIRTESGTEIGVDKWQYSASMNARISAGPERKIPADNASVDFLGFRYRDISASPGEMALRQWQNLANAGTVSLYIMGNFSNHEDKSSFEPSKRVFDFHMKHEKFLSDLSSAAKVLLVHRPMMARRDSEICGWVRALTENHIPFDEIDTKSLMKTEISRYQYIIIPDNRILKEETISLLNEYTDRGGNLIVSGSTGLRGDPATIDALGIVSCTGIRQNLMSTVLLNAKENHELAECRYTPYIAIGDIYIDCQYKTESEKYFQLINEHPFGPPERCCYTDVNIEAVPGIVRHAYGKGYGIYIPWNPGNFFDREGFENTLNFFRGLFFSVSGMFHYAPELTPMVELVFLKKQTGETVIELINTSGVFANSYYEPVPVTEIEIFLPGRHKDAKCLNGGTSVAVESVGNTLVKLNRLDEFEVIVLEKF